MISRLATIAIFAGILTVVACSDISAPTSGPLPSGLSRSGGSGSSGGGGSSLNGGSTSTVDVIKFTKHSYDAGSYELLVSASSSDRTARLFLYAQSGTYIGEVQNGGGGQYGGNVFVVLTDPISLTIKSSSGGSATIATEPFQP